MKTHMFIAMALLLISCSNEKPVLKNDLTNSGLKGNIKSVTEIDYKANLLLGEVITGDISEKRIATFNKDGNLESDKSYDLNDSLLYENYFRYDNTSKLVQKIEHSYTEIDILAFEYKRAHSISSVTYKYDSDGNLIETNLLNENGTLVKKHISLFDEKGNEITVSDYDPDGTLTSKLINVYDDDCKLIESNVYNPDGTLKIKLIHKYDYLDRLKEVYSLNSDLEIQGKGTCEYNEKGEIIELFDGITTSNYGKSIYQYDKYDNQDNWLYRLTSGNKMILTEREIVYY